MKKQLLFILLFVFSLLTQTPAWAISVANVQRKVADAERSHQRKSTGQKKSAPAKQGSAQTTTADEWYGLPIISWKEFERANEQIKQRDEEFFKLDEQTQGLIPTETLMAAVSFKQGRPNYAEFVQNVRYIYIGETHNEPAIEQEVKNLLTVIHQANPGKKILLATEFSSVPHPLINPLHRAENENLHSLSYDGIDELTERLHMDTLALDDNIIQFPNSSDLSGALLKVGNKYVRHDESAISLDNLRLNYAREIYQIEQEFSSQQKLSFSVANFFMSPNNFNEIYSLYKKEAPAWVAETEKNLDPGNGLWATGYAETRRQLEGLPSLSGVKDLITHVATLSYAVHLLQYSSWGVEQRNNQWAERIKNVGNAYDIVIIWAGGGHVDTGYPNALPYLIDSSDAIIFDFSAINSQMEDGIGLTYTKNRQDVRTDPDEMELSEEMRQELLKLEIDGSQTYYVEGKDIQYDKETEKKMAKLMGKEQFPNLPPRMISVFLE